MNVQVTGTEFENIILLYIRSVVMKLSVTRGDKMTQFAKELDDKAVDNLLRQLYSKFSPKEKLDSKRLINEINSGKYITLIA